MSSAAKRLIGRSTLVSFPELALEEIAARVDTGAQTSSLWANVEERGSTLAVTFLGPEHPQFTGRVVVFNDFERVIVASSMGHVQKRYKVRLLIKVRGKKVRAQFTLANRSTQVYPVLIGRNVLRGKFIVDVKAGRSLHDEEKRHSESLQSKVDEL